jgi:uncharacterized membrane protein
MKLSIAKGFLLLLPAGVILLALMMAGDQGLPGILSALRIVLGVVFVLLVPGYALQLALFPNRGDLDPLARTALSFGLSIAIIPPVFLVLSALRLEIRLWPIVMGLSLFTLICGLVALFRTRRLPESEKIDITVALKIKAWWAEQDRVFRWLYSGMAFFLVSAAVSAILVSLEKPGKPFTEFYLLDSEGLSEAYPREVIAGEPVEFRFGIVNHEGIASEFKIVAVQEGEKALGAVGYITLEDGAAWEGSMTFAMPQSGSGKEVEFFLERVGSPWPYRTLRVWLTVDPPEETPVPNAVSADGVSMGGFPRIGCSVHVPERPRMRELSVGV